MSAEVSAPQWRSLGFNGTSDGCGPPPTLPHAASPTTPHGNGGTTVSSSPAPTTALPDLIPISGGGGGPVSSVSQAGKSSEATNGEKHINHNNNIVGGTLPVEPPHDKDDGCVSPEEFNCELVLRSLNALGRDDGTAPGSDGGVPESNTDRDSGFETPSLDTTTNPWEKPEVNGSDIGTTVEKHRANGAEQGQHYVAHVVAGEFSESKDTTQRTKPKRNSTVKAKSAGLMAVNRARKLLGRKYLTVLGTMFGTIAKPKIRKNEGEKSCLPISLSRFSAVAPSLSHFSSQPISFPRSYCACICV